MGLRRLKVRPLLLARILPWILATGLLSGCVQVPILGQGNFSSIKQPLYGPVRLGQEFFSTDRNLMRVDVFFYPSMALKGKLNLTDRREALKVLTGKDVVMRLYSLPDRRQLVTLKQPVKKIRDATMYAFAFEPISGSKRKRYFVELEAPALTDETAISVGLTNIDRYGEGAAFVNGKEVPGADLRFQPFIDMGPVMLSHSIAARLVGDLPFVIVWALLVLMVTAMTARAWRHALASPTIKGKIGKVERGEG